MLRTDFMKKILNFIKSKFLMFIFALLLPLAATGAFLTYGGIAHAATTTLNYHTAYASQVKITNGNFDSSSSTDSLSPSLSGWTAQKPSTYLKKTGIINVGVSFDGDKYLLTDNPLAASTDKKILMINSRNEKADEYTLAQQGYKSSAISLSANSFYRFQVSFKSATYKNEITLGSIYLTGLVDENGNTVKAEFKQISSDSWTTYSFFVATGETSQTVNLELWLGGRELNAKSAGVVFFDDCALTQYSENKFWSLYNKNEKTSLSDLRVDNSIAMDGYNFDFEIATPDGIQPVTDWKKTGNGNAKVFDTEDPSFFKQQTGYDFVGSDLSCTVELTDNEVVSLTNNRHVLGLWANDEFSKVTSKDIAVDANTAYKITASYKISKLENGSAYLLVSENDKVLSEYNLTDLPDYYTIAKETASSALSSNGTSDFNNKYNTVEFYVKGGPLYNSSVNISLALGSATESAKGAIVFDNITIERVSSSTFADASNKIELGKLSGTLSVTNGSFNDVSFSKDSTYPLPADGWEVTSGDTAFAGVINSLQSEYQKYIDLYHANQNAGVLDADNPYLWASYYTSSPANSTGSTTVSDNIMMLANPTASYQTLKSSTLSLDANKKALLSFYFKTTTSIKVRVIDEKSILLFEEEISSPSWKQYEIYFQSANSAESIYVEIDLGTKNNQKNGFAFFDKFAFTTNVSSDTFAAKQAVAESNKNNFGVVDMTGNYLNLPTNNITADLDTSKTTAYTGTYVKGAIETNYGGVVSSDFVGTDSIYTLDEETPIFYFANTNNGSYRIQSNYNIDLATGYYVLSFKVRTDFAKAESELDSSKTYNYGLTVGLSGYDYIKNIRCDDGYETYYIYLHPTTSSSATLYMEFVSDCAETRGSAVVYDINLQNGSDVETDYENAVSKVKASDYNLNSSRVAVAYAEDASDEDEDQDEDQDSTTPVQNDALNWSLIISGLITAVAIILAVVFSILRHVKIKKIEIKRKESYDRRASLEIDALKKRAEAEQKKQAKEVLSNVAKLQAELEKLEKEHKEKVVTLRESDKGKVSKATDKEFKDFAKKRTAIAERIDVLNKKVEEIQSPEYLLALERKLYAKDEAEKRALKKASKGKK